MTETGDDGDSVECPTCGRTDFGSDRAMKIHHHSAHGESLSKPVECEVCGEEFEVRPHRVDEAQYCSYECTAEGRKNRKTCTCDFCGDEFEVPKSTTGRFCSRDCQALWLSENWGHGEDNPRWSGGKVTVACDQCGDDYEVVPARVAETRFCSYECKGEAYEVEKVGDQHPIWSGGLATVECEECGDEYEVFQAKVDSTRFCSRECFNKNLEHQTGQDNPNWRGGTSIYRAVRQQIDSPSWDHTRSEYTGDFCRMCGREEELELHHIVPLMDGGTNENWNLLTLCVYCHGRAESYTRSKILGHLNTPVLISTINND